MLFGRKTRRVEERIFPHFLVEKEGKKFHENDMLLRLAKANLQHGKRAKQQILHDVAKMILYKAYHLRQGLGLIMVIQLQKFFLWNPTKLLAN